MTQESAERAAHRRDQLMLYLLENSDALGLRIGAHHGLADYLVANVGVARDSLGGMCVTQRGHQGRDLCEYVLDVLASKAGCEPYFLARRKTPTVRTFKDATAALDYANGGHAVKL